MTTRPAGRRTPRRRNHVSSMVAEGVDRRERSRGCTGTVDENSSTTAGPDDDVAVAEPAAVVRGRVDPLVEEDPPAPRPRVGGLVAVGHRDPAQLGLADRSDAGDPEVDPLDLLPRIVAEVVAVQPPMLVVEASTTRSADSADTGSPTHVDPDLVRLPEVPQVGAALEDPITARRSPRARAQRRLRGSGSTTTASSSVESSRECRVTAVRT